MRYGRVAFEAERETNMQITSEWSSTLPELQQYIHENIMHIHMNNVNSNGFF